MYRVTDLGGLMMEWANAFPACELDVGEWRVLELDDMDIAIFNIDGEYFAIEDTCTHDGGCLTGGKIEANIIECPRHGAQFDIKTGQVLSPPAYEDLQTFTVRVNNDMLQIAYY